MLDANHDFIKEDHASTRKRLRSEANQSVGLASLKDAGHNEAANEQERKKQVFEGVIHKFNLFKLNVLLICESWPSFSVGLEGDANFVF